ncbi:hypothetical protein ACFVYG_03735 [Streptomyces sp. NPDC058256]|uniref:hypothetical protein n=1 Tax=Streptomyces sp. NPDC058256 TaxID=3346408 RepID=UPI0036ED3524
MSDSALWVAILTGGTAISASWVTSRGSRQAAREQAEIVATTQRRDRLREIRRTAYLDLIQHTQRQREILEKIREIVQFTDSEQRLGGLREQFRAAQHGYDEYLNLARVVEVEGPPQVIERAERLRKALSNARKAIKALAEERSESIQELERHNREAEGALLRFIDEVRAALDAM